MSSRTPLCPAPGVIGMSKRAAHSIVSLLPVTDGEVATRPEAPLVGENLLGPCPPNDLPRLLKARTGIRLGDVVDVVLARNTAGKPRDKPAVRHTVEHRKLFSQAERLVQRQ